MANCNRCGEEIEFVVAAQLSGKKVPVNPAYVTHEQLQEGQRLVTDGGNVVHKDPNKRYPNIRGRVIHFDTCVGSV